MVNCFRECQAWPEPQPTPGRHPLPPGTPPGPQNWPPEPQPTPGTQPCPPGPPLGPLFWPPEPQLPLASQPPPPGSCLNTTCVGAAPAVAEPAGKDSAAATGATEIAAAAAPPTSDFIRLNFANMRAVYPLPHMCKTSASIFAGGDSAGGYGLLTSDRRCGARSGTRCRTGRGPSLSCHHRACRRALLG
jgi:hypothetical protein